MKPKSQTEQSTQLEQEILILSSDVGGYPVSKEEGVSGGYVFIRVSTLL